MLQRRRRRHSEPAVPHYGSRGLQAGPRPLRRPPAWASSSRPKQKSLTQRGEASLRTDGEGRTKTKKRRKRSNSLKLNRLQPQQMRAAHIPVRVRHGMDGSLTIGVAIAPSPPQKNWDINKFASMLTKRKGLAAEWHMLDRLRGQLQTERAELREREANLKVGEDSLESERGEFMQYRDRELRNLDERRAELEQDRKLLEDERNRLLRKHDRLAKLARALAREKRRLEQLKRELDEEAAQLAAQREVLEKEKQDIRDMMPKLELERINMQITETRANLNKTKSELCQFERSHGEAKLALIASGILATGEKDLASKKLKHVQEEIQDKRADVEKLHATMFQLNKLYDEKKDAYDRSKGIDVDEIKRQKARMQESGGAEASHDLDGMEPEKLEELLDSLNKEYKSTKTMFDNVTDALDEFDKPIITHKLKQIAEYIQETERKLFEVTHPGQNADDMQFGDPGGPPTLEPGCKVQAINLKNAPEYNGRMGVILKQYGDEDGAWVVRLDDDEEEVTLYEKNLEPIQDPNEAGRASRQSQRSQGSLSRSKPGAMKKHETLHEFMVRLFEEADDNGDNVIDREEWKEVLTKLFGNITDAEVDYVFHRIDDDCNGVIEYEELAEKLEQEIESHPDKEPDQVFTNIFEDMLEKIREELEFRDVDNIELQKNKALRQATQNAWDRISTVDGNSARNTPNPYQQQQQAPAQQSGQQNQYQNTPMEPVTNGQWSAPPMRKPMKNTPTGGGFKIKEKIEVQSSSGEWAAAHIISHQRQDGKYQIRYHNGAERWKDASQIREPVGLDLEEGDAVIIRNDYNFASVGFRSHDKHRGKNGTIVRTYTHSRTKEVWIKLKLQDGIDVSIPADAVQKTANKPTRGKHSTPASPNPPTPDMFGGPAQAGYDDEENDLYEDTDEQKNQEVELQSGDPVEVFHDGDWRRGVFNGMEDDGYYNVKVDGVDQPLRKPLREIRAQEGW